MTTFLNFQNGFLDLSKLNANELKTIVDFYEFLIFKKKDKSENSARQLKKLPEVFYHSTKVDNYQLFDRNEIYG